MLQEGKIKEENSSENTEVSKKDNQEEEQQEEKQQEVQKSSAEGFLVVKDATCKCEFGGPPVKLQVTSHSKFYLNDSKGSKKMIATTKDNTFMPSNFVSCTKDIPYKMCKYAPTAQWKGEAHALE